jgi:hypothetical protein
LENVHASLKRGHVENKHKKLTGEIDALWLLCFNMNIIDQPYSYCMIAYRQVKSVAAVTSIRVASIRRLCKNALEN